MDISSNPQSPFFYKNLLGKKLFIVDSVEKAHSLHKKKALVCIKNYPKSIKTLKYFSTSKAVLTLCLKHYWEKPKILERWFFYGRWGYRFGTRLTIVGLSDREIKEKHREYILTMLSGSQCYAKRGIELIKKVLK